MNAARLLAVDELRGPHLVLANLGHDDGIVAGRACAESFCMRDLRNDLVRVLGDLRVVERVALAPFRDLRVPRLGDAACSACLLDRGDDARDDALQIADDGHLRLADLADLGRVDVDMDDLRHAVRTRRACPSRGRRSVRTARDDQVGLGHS